MEVHRAFLFLPTRLPVASYCKQIIRHGKGTHHHKMMLDVGEGTGLKHHHSHHFYEVLNRVEKVENFGPFGYAVNGREQAAEKKEDHQEEPRHKHRLLLRFGNGADENADTENGNQVDGEEGVKRQQASCCCNSK